MKIMIVEDEPIIRDMIGESIRKWGGYETIILDDFSQVLEIFLKENPPSCINGYKSTCLRWILLVQ